MLEFPYNPDPNKVKYEALYPYVILPDAPPNPLTNTRLVPSVSIENDT
jgi:hypothetical protein